MTDEKRKLQNELKEKEAVRLKCVIFLNFPTLPESVLYCKLGFIKLHYKLLHSKSPIISVTC